MKCVKTNVQHMVDMYIGPARHDILHVLWNRLGVRMHVLRNVLASDVWWRH